MESDGVNVLSTSSGLTIDFLYPVTVTEDPIVSPEEKGVCMASSTGESVTINCLGLTGGQEHHVTLALAINVKGNNLLITINTVLTGTQPNQTIPGNDMESITNNVTGDSTEKSTKFPLLSSGELPTFKSVDNFTGLCLLVINSCVRKLPAVLIIHI